MVLKIKNFPNVFFMLHDNFPSYFGAESPTRKRGEIFRFEEKLDIIKTGPIFDLLKRIYAKKWIFLASTLLANFTKRFMFFFQVRQ